MGYRTICLRYFLRTALALLIAECFLFTAGKGFALQLSPEEDAYLRSLGTVSICVDPDWEPFERLDQDGTYVGIAADLIHLIGKRAGVAFQVISTRDWDDSVVLSKAGQCDILAFLNKTPLRDQWLIFTAPYFVDPNVIVTRADHDYIPNLAAISNETMVLPKGTSVEERIRRDYPNVRLILVDSEAEAFRLVENREAEMTMRSLTMAAYTIKKEGWFNLKIAGEIPAYANRMRIGVVREKPVLRDILDKAVATVTPQEVNEIVSRHVSISVTTRIDYKLLFKVAFGFLAVVGLGLGWITVMRRKNRDLALLGDQLRRDMIARTEVEAALRASEERYRLLVEIAQEGIVVIQEEHLVYVNPMMSAITGHTADELKKWAFIHFVFQEDREMALENHRLRMHGKIIPRYQMRMLRKDGDIAWVEVSGARIEWGGHPASLNFLSDITDRKEIEEKIHFMAQHDPLTSLPNRALFFDRLERALALASRERRSLAVMFVDLNDFKPVNDSYGHGVGDLLLQSVARRIESALRASDTVARIGGDEFVVLLPNLEHPADVDDVAVKLGKVLSTPFNIDDKIVAISASIGTAVFPDHGNDAASLCRHADTMMYKDKARFKKISEMSPTV
jgi:diguanylate cyclase (GGDEF)-like protein/PAS domain S-box-containing protein